MKKLRLKYKFKCYDFYYYIKIGQVRKDFVINLGTGKITKYRHTPKNKYGKYPYQFVTDYIK